MSTLRLSQDIGCTRALLWRLEFEPPLPSTATLDAALASAGFELTRAPAGLRIYDHEDEDRVVFVPRTGRLQLRLSYLRPRRERVDDAISIAKRLAEPLKYRLTHAEADEG